MLKNSLVATLSATAVLLSACGESSVGATLAPVTVITQTAVTCATKLPASNKDYSITLNIPSDTDTFYNASPTANTPTVTPTTKIAYSVLLPERCPGELFPLILQSHGYSGTRVKASKTNSTIAETAHFPQIDELVSILPRKGSTGFRDQDDMIIVPLSTAMRRVLGKTYVDTVSIECSSPGAMPAAIDAIRQLMRKRHRLPAYKDDDFMLRNMADIQAALAGTSQIFSLLLGIVAAISLVVGGIGIMNIMLVSVSERTREIGLRKAIGATRRAVLIQFLIEAAAMSTLGGGIGILLGCAIAFGMSAWAGWAAIVTTQSIVLAFVFSASTGIVFGFWPARKASLLSPIEALRYE